MATDSRMGDFYADNSTRPLDTDLLRHVLHLYPLNQSWYIEDHYQALGHFAPYFIYQTQLKKDALQRMQIIQGSKVILPLELHPLTDSNLWDQQMRKMQADLAGSPSGYNSSACDREANTTRCGYWCTV